MLAFFWPSNQEGVRSKTFGRHASNRFNFIYSESWRQELSIGINMDQIGEGGGRGGSRRVFSFRGGVLQFFSGPLPRNFKDIVGILSSSPDDCHPF